MEGLKDFVDTLREEIAYAEENGITAFPIEVGPNGNPVNMTTEQAKALLAALTPSETVVVYASDIEHYTNLLIEAINGKRQNDAAIRPETLTADKRWDNVKEVANWLYDAVTPATKKED